LLEELGQVHLLVFQEFEFFFTLEFLVSFAVKVALLDSFNSGLELSYS
jgi:hypothetical protein